MTALKKTTAPSVPNLHLNAPSPSSTPARADMDVVSGQSVWNPQQAIRDNVGRIQDLGRRPLDLAVDEIARWIKSDPAPSEGKLRLLHKLEAWGDQLSTVPEGDRKAHLEAFINGLDATYELTDRTKMLVQNPFALASQEFSKLVAFDPNPTPEAKALQNRLEKLADKLQETPPSERPGVFFDQFFHGVKPPKVRYAMHEVHKFFDQMADADTQTVDRPTFEALMKKLELPLDDAKRLEAFGPKDRLTKEEVSNFWRAQFLPGVDPTTAIGKAMFAIEDIHKGINTTDGIGTAIFISTFAMTMGSLAVSGTPVATAAAVALTLQGARDVGQVFGEMLHRMGDEYADQILKDYLPEGITTSTGFKSYSDMVKFYEDKTHDVPWNAAFTKAGRAQTKKMMFGFERFSFEGILHHINENKLANKEGSVFARDIMWGRSLPLLVPAALQVMLHHPAVSLAELGLIGFSATMNSGVVNHMQSHRAPNQRSLFALGRQAYGKFIGSQAMTGSYHTKGHHHPVKDPEAIVKGTEDHAQQYGAWDTKVDRFLDDSGIGDMISLLMYANGQKDGGEPTAPVSWRKNPNLAKKFLGDALDVEKVEAPLRAKAGLIEAYDLLRSEHVKARQAARKERNLSKSDEVALGLEVTARDAAADTAELSRIAEKYGLEELLDGATDLTEAMIRLRKAVDGIETSNADIAQTLVDGKYGQSFMMELIPAQAPGAWPKIDSAHVMDQIKTIWAEHHASDA